jgi:outer membrane protein OmpA-like peptidoglycan-associated protein
MLTIRIMNHRSWSRTDLGGLAAGTLLIAGCASANPRQPSAESPSSGVAVLETKPRAVAVLPPSVPNAADVALESAQAAANPRDWTSTPADSGGTKSLKSLDRSAAPFMFARRRASEALDKLAGLVVVRHDKRGDVITLLCDKMVEPGQWAINVSGQYALRELAPKLRDQDGHVLVIQGYTDSMGTSDLNDALSLRRAEAVRDFLTTQGVSADSMRAEGLGARRPVASNATVDGRTQNRRIEIVIAP